MRSGKCSVCGGRLDAGSSVCTQCKGTSRGHFRHLQIRSFVDVLAYPIALIVLFGGCGLLFWLLKFLQ